MTARILPPKDWHRVTLPETAALVPYLRPDRDDVIVVEAEDGRIVGAVALQETLNAHGYDTAPDLRGQPAIIFRALREMRALAAAKGYAVIQTGIVSEDMAGLCTALKAAEVPGRVFLIPVEG